MIIKTLNCVIYYGILIIVVLGVGLGRTTRRQAERLQELYLTQRPKIPASCFM